MSDSNRLPEVENTAFQEKQKNEEALRRQQANNIQANFDLASKALKDLAQLSRSQLNKLSDYRETTEKALLELKKHHMLDVSLFEMALGKQEFETTKKGEIAQAELKKQLQKQVSEYTSALKKEQLLQDRQDFLNSIVEKRKLEFDNSVAKANQDRKFKLESHDLDAKLREENHDSMLRDYQESLNLTKREKNQKLANIKDLSKDQKKAIRDEAKARKKELVESMKAEGATDKEIQDALVESEKDEKMTFTEALNSETLKQNIDKGAQDATNRILDNIKSLFESYIQDFQNYQSKVDVRLQGVGTNWNLIEKDLRSRVGITPYVKTKEMFDNVVKATEQGIAFNIEQRAFLSTISDKVAATFDAFNSNLSRIIRIQQADSTAARLGMESSLTKFLNSNFEDNSYLASNLSDTVSENLIEATSQMNARDAVSFEYQVQKWLGSLSSVGFSSNAISSISQALGQLGSGNVSSLAGNSTMQNLLVMSANRAGLNYSDLLINGLDSSNTNKLLRSMVDYLQEIAESNNKVVKSEYAKVFGMSVSDLSAVTNLRSQLNNIESQSLNYTDALLDLYGEVATIGTRMSMGEMLGNAMDNAKFSISSSIADNPVLYPLWEVTSMIEDLTGGINLPTFSFVGNMVDLNTTVTNLMRAGIVGVSTLGAIGDVINGLTNTVIPTSMLAKLGISRDGLKATGLNGQNALFDALGLKKKTRGSGLGGSRKGRIAAGSISSSTFVGNSSGEDYYETTMTSANDQVNTTMEAKAEENKDMTMNHIQHYLVDVFDPKINSIQRMLGSLSGYTVTSGTGEGFKIEDTSSYGALKTSVAVGLGADGKEALSTSGALKNISESSSSILALLNEVVSGTKSLNVITHPYPSFLDTASNSNTGMQ